MGIGLVEESNMAIWVGDVSLTLSALAHCVGSNACRGLSHGFALDGNDLTPRHVSKVLMIGMANLVLCSGKITFLWGE